MKIMIRFILCAMLIAGLAAAASFADGSVDVISCEGDVKVLPAGEKDEVDCSPGMALDQGARVKTGRDSYAELAFNKTASNVVRVEEKTEVVIKLSKADRIELVDGELFTALEDMEPGQTFQVRTPCATCGARGTAWSTKTSAGETTVSVAQDKVFVKGLKRDGTEMKAVWVDKGFQTRIKRFERPGRMEKISDARMAKMENKITRVMKREKPKVKALKKEVRAKKPMEDRTRKMDSLRARKDRADKVRIMEKREAIVENRIERTDNIMEQRQETVVERKDEQNLGTRDETKKRIIYNRKKSLVTDRK